MSKPQKQQREFTENGPAAKQEEEMRQRIVDAAIGTCHGDELGRPGATVQAIADKAEVGRVTVYRHCPDDDAILDVVRAMTWRMNPPPGISQWSDIGGRPRPAIDFDP